MYVYHVCAWYLQRPEKGVRQVPWLWSSRWFEPSLQLPGLFQEADFPFLKSELALRAALTDYWEGWQYTSTREPVKLEFYLGNPRPPSCGTAPNEGLHRGRSSAILCSHNEPSPFTDLPSECNHGSRQNQQKNLSRGPTKEWKVL